jgi:hypothetical protein
MRKAERRSLTYCWTYVIAPETCPVEEDVKQMSSAAVLSRATAEAPVPSTHPPLAARFGPFAAAPLLVFAPNRDPLIVPQFVPVPDSKLRFWAVAETMNIEQT